jgi:hypothetical protein
MPAHRKKSPMIWAMTLNLAIDSTIDSCPNKMAVATMDKWPAYPKNSTRKKNNMPCPQPTTITPKVISVQIFNVRDVFIRG